MSRNPTKCTTCREPVVAPHMGLPYCSHHHGEAEAEALTASDVHGEPWPNVRRRTFRVFVDIVADCPEDAACLAWSCDPAERPDASIFNVEVDGHIERHDVSLPMGETRIDQPHPRRSSICPTCQRAFQGTGYCTDQCEERRDEPEAVQEEIDA